jgi:hypothetical protein
MMKQISLGDSVAGAGGAGPIEPSNRCLKRSTTVKATMPIVRSILLLVLGLVFGPLVAPVAGNAASWLTDSPIMVTLAGSLAPLLVTALLARSAARAFVSDTSPTAVALGIAAIWLMICTVVGATLFGPAAVRLGLI